MQRFKFLHTADLHLDVPMQKLPKQLALGAEASFIALDRLVEIALQKQVDALLFVGDIWNDEDASLKARLRFKKACDILNTNKIEVYVAHGNHDPLTKNFKNIKYPANVHLFPAECSSFDFYKDTKKIACIHGISHASKKESTNLSKLFPQQSRKSKDECFQIHLLHTSLVNNEDEDRYAPCSIADLIEKNPHYWALGHIHKYQVLEKNPYIVFPGALQGTHINEEDEHGCVYVELQRDESNQHVEIVEEFISLAPLLWKKVEYALDPQIDNILEMQEKIHEFLLEEKQKIVDLSQERIEQIVLRLVFVGKSLINAELRDIYKLKELQLSLNEELAFANPPLYIKDIEVKSENIEEEKNIEMLLKSETFLAEVLQKGQDLYSLDEQALANEMEKIYKEAPILKGHAHLLTLPKQEEFYKDIILRAQYLAAQLLEKPE